LKVNNLPEFIPVGKAQLMQLPLFSAEKNGINFQD